MEKNMTTLCPICQRDLDLTKAKSDHHLIPKTFKGEETVLLHDICHRKLHATLTEREMYNYYHTIERLLEHEEIQKFVKWVKNKHPDFYSGSDDTNVRSKKRRR